MLSTGNLRMTNKEIDNLPETFREAMRGLEAQGLLKLSAIDDQTTEVEVCSPFKTKGPFAILVDTGIEGPVAVLVDE